MAYRSANGSGTSFPKVRFWNSSGAGSWGSEIELPTAGSPVREAVVKESPVSTKIIVVTQSDDGNIDAYACFANCANASNWVVTNNIGSTGTPVAHSRRFDLEFETGTGNAMVVYAINSANTSRDLAFKTLPALSASFSGSAEQYIDDSLTGGGENGGSDLQYTWVSLDRKPVSSSSELVLAGFDGTGNDINAWVWGGSSWANQVAITTGATATGGFEALAVKYAADGSKAMVIGGSGSAGDVNGQYWNGASWTSANIGDINGGGGDNEDVLWLTLKADPATDDLQAVGVETDNDLDTVYWNGAAWSITQGIDVGIDATSTRPADFDWNPTGSTGKLVWDTDGAGTTLSQRTCSPQCTGATSTISTYAGTGAWLALYRDPTAADQVNILGARLNSAAALGSLMWNGTAFTNYGDAVIAANATNTTFESFTIAFQLSTFSPVISSCQLINSSGSYILTNNLAGAPISASPLLDTACIKINASNVLLDCNGFNVTNNGTGGTTYGILLAGPLNNVSVRNCNVANYTNGVYLYFANNSSVTNSSAVNNSAGFSLASSTNNTLQSDTATNNFPYGFQLSGSSGNNLTGNTGSGNNETGFFLVSTNSNNRLVNNTANNNVQNGFLVTLSSSNVIANNNASGNGVFGFDIASGSNSNSLSNNTAALNSQSGFMVFSSSGNTLSSNNASGNSQNGFFVQSSNSTTLSSNRASGNGLRGTYLLDSNLTAITSDRYFNNNPDFEVSGTGIIISLSGVVFDNPSGTLASYTNLSINDTVSSSYTINWSANTTTLPLPSDHTSFAQKFVNITNLTPVSVDSITWHWLNSESTGLNESALELWKFNASGWTKLNSTPDTSGNMLSLSNLDQFSIFAILLLNDTTPPNVTLNSPANGTIFNATNNVTFNFTATDSQSATMNCSLFIDGVLNQSGIVATNNTPATVNVNNISPGNHAWNVSCSDAANNTGNSTTLNFFIAAVGSCPIITSSGSYVQINNLVGGSNSVSPPSVGGFSTVCVKIGVSNVVYDCNGFSITNDGTNNRMGVFSNSSHTNITLKNCDVSGYKVGVYILSTNNSAIMNNTVRDSAQDGMHLDQSFNNNLTNNTFRNNSQNGIQVGAGANHIFINNIAFNNSQDGISLTSSPNNQFLNNVLFDNKQHGLDVVSSDNNTIVNNSAYNNTNDGIHVASSDNNLIENNTAITNKQDGIQVVTNANNTFRNNIANGNTQHGLHVVGTNINLFFNNTMGFNLQDGMSSSSSTNSSFTNNSAFSNGHNGFRFASSDFDSMTNNTAFDNAQDGLNIDDSDHTTLLTNHYYNNSRDFRMISASSRIVNMTTDIFDRPGDGFANFTNLSLNATEAASTFTMTWSPRPGALPVGCPAFADQTTGEKYLNISNVSGSVLLDSVAWHWRSDESAPYNESWFRLARYNGTAWSAVANQVLDTAGNQIGVTSIDKFGVFAILVCNDSVSALKLNQTLLQASPGGIVQFNITVNNTGNATLSPVQVIDVLPAGLTFASASPVPDSVAGQTVTWDDVGPLLSGNSAVLYVNATVDSGVVSASVPQLNLTNFVNTTGTDPLGFNVSANSSADVTVYYANITIVKLDITPITPVSPGGFVLWNISVSNPGEVPLNVTLVDTLPPGFQFAGSSFSPISVSPDNRTIVWADVALPGDSGSLTLNSTVAGNLTNGTYCNNATVTGMPPNGDNVTANDTSCVGIFAPAINLVKTVNQSFNVTVGDNVTYTLNVTNTGSVNLTVSVIDVLPGNVSFQGADVAPTSVVGQTISWLAITVLAPGGSFAIHYNVSSNSSGTYANNATATGAPPNGNNVSDSDSASFTSLPRPSDDDDDEGKKNMQLAYSFLCPGNLVVFNSTKTDDNPLQGVQVQVIEESPFFGTIGYDTSDAAGISDMALSVNGSYKAKATKAGYNTEEVTFDFGTCPPVGCQSDPECPSAQQCISGQCKDVVCKCGSVSNHSCVKYQCCSDSDCPSGQMCQGNQCVPKPECTNDSDCKSADFCDIPANQTGGKCRPVAGCGTVGNHTLVPYAFPYGCANSACPACPLGYSCRDNTCLLRNITCPETGFIGTSVTCNATEGNRSCSFCDLTVIKPNGVAVGGRTGENGTYNLTLDFVGKYNVSLLSNGTSVRSIAVTGLAASVPELPTKPGILDICPIPWWILLLLLVIAFIIYWRSREKEKPPAAGKGKPGAK
ncbi:MAG TPA: NosD domain-containing protein [Candidatus Bilamarchaeum sp.]|nr:NosD domain-containing protein [Candidatus Bilamarchaeum sp.]